MWGLLATHGEACLRQTRDADRQREVLSNLFTHRLADGATVLTRVALWTGLKATNCISIEALASVAMGSRALRRRFADQVGLGPERLQRAFRFNAVIGRLADLNGKHTPAAELAAEIGYADQAHMVRANDVRFDARVAHGCTPRFLFVY
jgi:AraC-like DNA-binding protein